MGVDPWNIFPNGLVSVEFDRFAWWGAGGFVVACSGRITGLATAPGAERDLANVLRNPSPGGESGESGEMVDFLLFSGSTPNIQVDKKFCRSLQ